MTTIWFAIMYKSFFVTSLSCRGSFSLSNSPPPSFLLCYNHHERG
nr:MAG TPA: hypothetical protein [Caudoviricetes sp.]